MYLSRLYLKDQQRECIQVISCFHKSFFGLIREEIKISFNSSLSRVFQSLFFKMLVFLPEIPTAYVWPEGRQEEESESGEFCTTYGLLLQKYFLLNDF